MGATLTAADKRGNRIIAKALEQGDLAEGADQPAVQWMKRMLEIAGFRGGVGDQRFGPGATRSLEEFQASVGLTPTGALDAKTFEKLKGVELRERAHEDLFVGPGQKSRAVKENEARLRRLGYDPGKVDGVFDPQTARAISELRRDEGKKFGDKGILNDRVAKAMRKDLGKLDHAAFHARLKPSKQHRRLDALTGQEAKRGQGVETGDAGRAVANIKAHLKAAGYDPKGSPKHYDARTAGTVEAFQRENGLPATGRVDEKTWAALKKAYLYAKSGTRPAQRWGEHSGAVRHTQRLMKKLGFDKLKADGFFGQRMENAVKRFEKKQHRHVDGRVGGGDVKAMKHVLKARRNASSRHQRLALLRVAQANAAGKHPMGWCLREVQDDLEKVKYGKIGHGAMPRLPYARDFATYLNTNHRYRDLGLKRLHLDNPYDAPPGAIIVVRAGTPGTAHPFAGDIVVRGRGSHLYNDGEMSYGGPGNFPKGNNYVLGIYVPK